MRAVKDKCVSDSVSGGVRPEKVRPLFSKVNAFPNDDILFVDTHVHTTYSDGEAGLPAVEEACRRKSLGVCITDHNEIRGSLRLWERRSVPTTPSLEIGSRERIELILYFRQPWECEDFFRREVEPYRRKQWYAFLPRSLDYLVKAAAEREALISLPHPYAPLWKNVDYGRKRRGAIQRAMGRADCIEVYNGSLNPGANERAVSLCRELACTPLGGSDAHRIEQVGSVVVAFEQGVTSENLFDLIKHGQVAGVLGEEVRPKYVSNTWHLAIRHSKKFISGYEENWAVGRLAGWLDR